MLPYHLRISKKEEAPGLIPVVLYKEQPWGQKNSTYIGNLHPICQVYIKPSDCISIKAYSF